MHHASPVRWCGVLRMRYMTGSRRLMLPLVMSIFARSVLLPSGNSPARMRRGPAVAARQTEVDADRLGVTDVQVAVGLGRKARDDLPAEPAAAVVLLDDLPNEIGPRRFAHRPDRITALSADRTVGHRGRLMIIASCSSRRCRAQRSIAR